MVRDLLRERSLWWSGSGAQVEKRKAGRECSYPQGKGRRTDKLGWGMGELLLIPDALMVESRDPRLIHGPWKMRRSEGKQKGKNLGQSSARGDRGLRETSLYFFQQRDFIWGRTDGEFWNCSYIFSTPRGKSKNVTFPTDESWWFARHAYWHSLMSIFTEQGRCWRINRTGPFQSPNQHRIRAHAQSQHCDGD